MEIEKKKATHMAEVVPVVLLKHPDADKLSVVMVYNFTVVVNTADWQGVEKAVYVQPDSVMPDTPEYRFLKETGNLKKLRDTLVADLAGLENFEGQCRGIHRDGVCNCAAVIGERYKKQLAEVEEKIDKNTKYLRIAVRKLRGVISMGMLLPIPPCEHCRNGHSRTGRVHTFDTCEGSEAICTDLTEIGDDLAGALGITHYEPPTREQLDGSRKHAGDDVASAPPMIYAPKYDVESIYKYADCFEAGEPVYVSEKLDGQNARYVSTLEPEERSPGTIKQLYTFHAGSRTEWKKKEGGSNWWRVMETHPWIQEWMTSNPELVMYGEVFGWVAPLTYGAKQGQLFFRAFDVMEGTEYWDAEKFLAEIPEEYRTPSFGVMPFDFEKLKALADNLKSSIFSAKNQLAEGIVVKPIKERKHWKLGRVVLKVVSNQYLEKQTR